MTSDEATIAVIDSLGQLGIPYMLVGSLSSNYYGISRSKKDADFVVELGDASIATVAGLLKPSIRVDLQMRFETATMTRLFRADVVDSPFKIRGSSDSTKSGASPKRPPRGGRRFGTTSRTPGSRMV